MVNIWANLLGNMGASMFGGVVVAVNLQEGFKPPYVWFILFGSVVLMWISAKFQK